MTDTHPLERMLMEPGVGTEMVCTVTGHLSITIGETYTVHHVYKDPDKDYVYCFHDDDGDERQWRKSRILTVFTF